MSCRRRIILPSIVPVALSSLIAAGCGGGSPRVASVPSALASTAASTSPAGTHANALAFARCVRNHGIADFPDPDSRGNLDLKSLHPGPGSDLDPGNSRFEAAQRACKALQPTTFSPGQHRLSAAQRQRDLAEALRFSRCMRAHGLPNFPDPDSNGRLTLHSIRSAGSGSASPQLQTALKACERYRPDNIAIS
jgi:hypothetical protein